MATQKDSYLSIVLSLLISCNQYANDEIRLKKFRVINNVWYQYYSSDTIIQQISVRKGIQCAGQCTQNPTCRTATFDQTNRLCLLSTEFTTIGQLIPNNQAITFEYQNTQATLITTTEITTSTTANATTSTITSITPETTITASSTTPTQSSYTCGNMTVLYGYDLFGFDITNSYLANYSFCCSWCLSYSGCLAFTWRLSTSSDNADFCYLKSAIPTPSLSSNLVSAYY